LPLYNYVQTNNCSEEAQNFAQLAIEALMNDGEVDFEDRIIYDPSTIECALDIMLDLHNKDTSKSLVPDLEGVSHLSQIILNMFAASKDYSLHFKVAQLGTNSNGDELNGRTVPIGGNHLAWEITIDSDLVQNGTRLFIAKTIIHEVMHAYINFVLRENPLSNMVNELQRYNLSLNNSNLTHHEFIGQYVDALASSLSVWDNHAQDMSYYKMLSWGGLETSSAYQAQNNQSLIQSAIQNERYGNSNARGEKCSN
jgi:hypothetical protein